MAGAATAHLLVCDGRLYTPTRWCCAVGEAPTARPAAAALIHEIAQLRPRPATSVRGKHRQFMQNCILTEEFASEKTFGQAATVFRRQSQDPRPDRARGGAGPGRVVMGWSGAPFPPLKAAQGQRVVEKGADVARGCLLRDSAAGSSTSEVGCFVTA